MADGMNFTQYQPPQQTNPLQDMGQMQAMMARGQEMQQQAAVNKAKMALGQIAQQAYNPETGEMDMNKLLSIAATHPDAALLYPDMAKDALQMGLISAQKHNAELEGKQTELKIVGNAFAPLLEKDNPSEQDLAGTFAQLGNALQKPSGWAAQQLVQFKQLKQNGLSEKQFIKNAALQTEIGQRTLENTRETWKAMNEPVTVFENGAMTPITRAEFLARQQAHGNLVAGGLAPSSGMAGRGEGAPSISPPDYSERSIASAPPPGYEEEVKGKVDAWNKLRNEVAEGSQTATQSEMQINDMSKKLEDMGYRTGTFSPELMQIAKAALSWDKTDPLGLATKVLDAQTPEEAMKIVGLSEAFDKQSLLRKVEALRQAMGSGAARLTQGEFQKFQDNLESLRTSPRGIAEIFNYMQKLNRLAQTRSLYLTRYEERLGHTPIRNDAVRFERAWGDFVAQNPGLYSFEAPKKEEK